ncbi:MAG: enoyl-CoA hydratase/isomerase family protein [Dehalococcoidales bacterium]|nr:enoyl-CoA hydratase/isomerase family protein [Dehalococcoidales bacterium]
MKYTRLLYEKQEHIATVTLSRPEARNAWSAIMQEEILDLFPKIEADPDVLVVILTGNPEGRAFSSGADIADLTTHSPKSVGDELHKFTLRGMDIFNVIADFPKPIICAINGYALGIGFQITLCCDILIASDNARMGLPQVSIGVMPAYAGAVRLARFVGKGIAMRMALTSEHMNAQDAYRLGLVSEVLPLEQLMPRAREIAKIIASYPPLSVKVAKESLNMGLDTASIKQAAQADLYRFLALSLTEDRMEGHSAWREKRKPTFKGK